MSGFKNDRRSNGTNYHPIIHDCKHYPREEIERMYGIQIGDDKTVFDPIRNKTFKDVTDWAAAEMEEDDDYEVKEKFSKYSDDIDW